MNNGIVVIPTYNEIENIVSIIEAVFSLGYNLHILIVDDQSPDGTAGAVKEMQIKYPDTLFLQERKGKLGLGTAYVHGFNWALSNSYEFIYEMDADFSHNPKDLVHLHKACLNGADMSVGSRYIKGVNVVNWPLSRVLLSYFASVYVNLITGMKIHDTTAGFVCYKSTTLNTIDLNRIKFVGYAFQIEMKYRVFCKDLNIVEVPIIFTDRTKGESKMSNSIIKEAVFGVISLRLKKLFNTL